MRVIPAKIRDGYVPVFVDDDDYPYLSQFTWGVISSGYVARQVYSHSVKRPGKKRAQSYYKKSFACLNEVW